MSIPIPTALIGATGYAGLELLRMLWGHPRLELRVVAAGRSAGGVVSDSWPHLTGHALGAMSLEAVDVERIAAQAKVVFLALPHGVSAPIAAQLLALGVLVVDLSADFRLRDPQTWTRSYGTEHPHPELLAGGSSKVQAVYGLVEHNAAALPGAQLIAAPGCYPTATTLAAKPLVDALGVDWIIADCMSGVSGAGRKPGARNLYCGVNESVSAYGMGGTHRHSLEMEQNLAPASVSFTPHLVPMTRGLLATVHARPSVMPTLERVREVYAQAYQDCPLIVMRETPPATADVRGSCMAHLHVAVDSSRGTVSVSCAIDNLLKGAGGQALQALNVSLNWPQTLGLPLTPVLP